MDENAPMDFHEWAGWIMFNAMLSEDLEEQLEDYDEYCFDWYAAHSEMRD